MLFLNDFYIEKKTSQCEILNWKQLLNIRNRFFYKSQLIEKT